MNEHLSNMQCALLDTFKAYVEYCEKNHLTYYAGYGTLIGAVRHKGFIPWDDDIDVYMKRADYDRFMALRGTLDGERYGICDILDGDSPYPFAKFYSKTGTIWEYRHFPFVIGPWIDVYPLDEGTRGDAVSADAYKRLYYAMWKYRKALANVPFKEIMRDISHLNFIDAAIDTVKKLRYTPFQKQYLKEVARCIDVIKGIKGDSLQGYLGGVDNEFFEKRWFDKVDKVPFEDTEIMIPHAYHEILTFWYGDYMTPPPVEDRKPTHGGFYSDLTRTRSLKELMKDPNVLKRKTNHLSLKVIIDEIRHRKGFTLK